MTGARCFAVTPAALRPRHASAEEDGQPFAALLAQGGDESAALRDPSAEPSRSERPVIGPRPRSGQNDSDDSTQSGASPLPLATTPDRQTRPSPAALAAQQGSPQAEGEADSAPTRPEGIGPAAIQPLLGAQTPITPLLTALPGAVVESDRLPRAVIAAPAPGGDIYRVAEQKASQDVPLPAGFETATPTPAEPGGNGNAPSANEQVSPTTIAQGAKVPVTQGRVDNAQAAPDELAVAIRLDAQTKPPVCRTNHAGPSNPLQGLSPEKEIQPVAQADATAWLSDRRPAAGLWVAHDVQIPGQTRKSDDMPPPPAAELASSVRRVDSASPKAPGPLKELSIQVGQTGPERVELRLTERGGELRVLVRAADPELAHGLRQALPELVNRLESQGFRTEAWRPSGSVNAPAASSESQYHPADSGNGDPQQQPGWSQRGHDPHNHNHNQPDRPKWVAELEGGLARGGEKWTGESYGLSD